MTSDPRSTRRVFVWTWPPDATEPVVAGAVDRVGPDRWDFTYARSYLDNDRAISVYAPELPLRHGAQEPRDGLGIAACLEDATPDSWGERVIANRLASGESELDLETSWNPAPTGWAPSTSSAAPRTTCRGWTPRVSTSCTTPPRWCSMASP